MFWPFNKKEEKCESHDWKEKETSFVPNRLFTDEDGNICVFKETSKIRKCKKCGEKEKVDESNKFLRVVTEEGE